MIGPDKFITQSISSINCFEDHIVPDQGHNSPTSLTVHEKSHFMPQSEIFCICLLKFKII